MPTVSFERSHDIVIAAPPEAVLDYVSNPHSWPEWLAASHHIDGPDRPLLEGDTFREKWHIRSGEVQLEWRVTECVRGVVWQAEAMTSFIGKIVARYRCQKVDGGTKYTRTVINPARTKAPSAEQIRRMDEEAAIALRNIKANVEKRVRNA